VCVPLTRIFRFSPLYSLLALGILIGCKESGTGLDPDNDCDVVGTLAIGATLTGSLADTDCEEPGGQRSDRYTFTTSTQQAVRFSQTSAAIDTYFELYDGAGELLAANDDSASVRGHPTSTLKMILPAGSYELSPSSYEAGETGAYSLTATAVPESGNVCDYVFAMKGVSTLGELATGDCTTGGTTPYLFEMVVVAMHAGRTYTISMNSTAFDTYLELGPLDGNIVASNDDFSPGTNSRIVFTPTSSNFYVIYPSSAAHSTAGAYTLIIQ
jgi:hypothetical protein